MRTDLTGKVVLITGSSSGIGRATALAYAAEGARVGITYHDNRDGAEQTAEAVRGAGGEADISRYDLRDERTAREAVERLTERWGGLDVLVANAISWGEAIPRPGAPRPAFEDVPAKQWQDVLQTTIGGTYHLVQAALPAMRGRPWGRIVFLGAGLADTGVPGAGSYGAGKSALYGLARSLAWELGDRGILVNTVVPGQTLTGNVLTHMPAPAREAKAATLPTRRMSTPEDVAAAVLFLGSAANGNTTGETLRVTGGS
ncbi:3-oxoacyl-[acyl-carrier protein] reductase [Actinoplanes octamycinicus]|uniref:3-oxoacyl-[acyl-carrier protein] reductase n=1 Tax=Actinoplanes octamycinicus TaxID=135948 RepID=A0A7W7H3J6_9ACTN|nr:SDR family oxidoreductase [Actinoplanes octamycinicus]MBB4743336.1 3-oxoacyl-[acyl-carrier protein] reductase [Actinoplanes octamycinicus]GIE61852.1 3-ketoacyl-ACP reductase [Actinoplanes octamycinicus]